MKKLFILQINAYADFSNLDLVTLMFITLLFSIVIVYGMVYQKGIRKKSNHFF